jgi:hypothetical protein
MYIRDSQNQASLPSKSPTITGKVISDILLVIPRSKAHQRISRERVCGKGNVCKICTCKLDALLKTIYLYLPFPLLNHISKTMYNYQIGRNVGILLTT